MAFAQSLEDRLASERESIAFKAYVRTRDRVLSILGDAGIAEPSAYWREEIKGFDYLFDAGPLIVAALREHCYHITGLKSYDYRQHHAHRAEPLARKLELLRTKDSRDLFVPESPVLGGFGHSIDGALVNLDTLKFYESLIAMDGMGLLEPSTKRRAVVEIGAGWGGFARAFRCVAPDTTYVIVDLPQTLLFSGTYLQAAFPDAKCVFLGEVPKQELVETWRNYDFVFIPHYAFNDLDLSGLDLAVNMVSFQEMTSTHVADYGRRLAELGVCHLYSHNRDRSPHNSELDSVPARLRNHYDLTEHSVLPVDYTVTAVAEPYEFLVPRTLNPKRFAKTILRKLIRAYQSRAAKQSTLHYRHFLGTLRKATI